MFKNRVQIGRLDGVDGLVGNAGNLEWSDGDGVGMGKGKGKVKVGYLL